MDYLSTVRVLDTDYKIKDVGAARINHTHKVEEIEGAAKEGHQHQASEIAGLSTVATSGSYSDLSGKPSAATESADGLMTAADKKKLDGIKAGAQANAVESVNGKTGTVKLGASDVGAAPAIHNHDASLVRRLVVSAEVTSGGSDARPVHRFATWTISAQYRDCSSILLLHRYYNGGEFAVIKLSARTNADGHDPSISARVLACSKDFDPGLIKVARSGKSENARFDAFAIIEDEFWIRTSVVNLTYWDYNSQFTMIDSHEDTDASKCYECWASINDAATALVGKPYDSVEDSVIDGMASYATSLSTPRTIALSGAATGSAKFDGSGNVTISTTANESYISSPISGLYNMSVDADGNLWVYHSDSDKAPNFEYDSATGNLYYVTEA